jgi:uncharacterized protein GlcG (DUF336 family)
MKALNAATTQQLIEQANIKANSLGVSACIAIVDNGAHLLAFQRMDGAFPGAVDVSIRKARTSALFPLPSGDFGQLIRSAELTGMELSNGMLAAFPGGIPLKKSGEVLGAIGVSGGTAEQDLEIATFAIDNTSV